MAQSKSKNMALTFVDDMLRGAGQVMFQNNAWTGLLFFCGIFWGAYETDNIAVAWGALAGIAVSTLTGRILRYPAIDGRQGLWGFNGILVGCAFPTFMSNTPAMWLALMLCSALTVWVRNGMNRILAPMRVNSFTFPFVFCTWIFLAAARTMHGLAPDNMADPALPATMSSASALGFDTFVLGWLRGVSQVFLIDSWPTGVLFLLGLAVCSRWAALWAAAGSALAMCIALLFGASAGEIAHGLYGYSPVLTAIALATVFYRPNLRSSVWAVLGIIVTVFIQAAMNVMLSPLGLATLTAPFCVATWLFLLPILKLDSREKPDHTDWYKSHKEPRGNSRRKRKPQTRKTTDA